MLGQMAKLQDGDPCGLVGQKWCDSTDPGSQNAGRPGDVSDTETPGSVMPRLLRDREDGGFPSCGLGDGEAIFSKKRQKPRLFLQTCRGK